MATSKLDLPKFSSSKPYERYKVELEAWSLTTAVAAEKQGLTVALSLPEDDVSNICDKVFTEIDIKELNKADGLKNLLLYFDKQFGRDDMSVAYEKYMEFERYKRRDDQTVNEYILEFEQKYNACIKKGSKYPSEIIAMKLIDNCNLSSIEQKIVLTEVDYSKKDEMLGQAKNSLKKFLGEQVGSGSSLEQTVQPSVKLETFLTDNHDVLIANGWRKRSGSEPPSYQNFNQRSGRSSYHKEKQTFDQFNYKKENKKFSNPSGKDGNIKRCFYCDSTMHLKQNCPHRGQKLNDEQVILFTENDGRLALLVRESWDSMVLDSACTKTVCGQKWLNEYMSALDPSIRDSIKEEKSDSNFKFGNDGSLPSLKRVLLPCNVAGNNIMVYTDVVDSSIPLLLSLESMKKAKIVWDFANQEVYFLGSKVPLDTTSCGHHCISIKPELVKVEECFTILENTDDRLEVKQKIEKLHKQFSHPTKDNMITLLKDGGYSTENYMSIIDKMYEDGETCQLFQKTPDRPVVSMPEARSFCELIVMDLKVWKMGTIYITYD